MVTLEETHLTLYFDFKKREGTLVAGVEAMVDLVVMHWYRHW